jgi:type II secretory pathway component PulF
LKNKSSFQNGTVVNYFELSVNDPEQEEKINSILNHSPAINQISEMETKKKKMTKDELKEMVRQELQAVLAEKKKVKGEDKKEKIDENEDVNESLLADAAPILATLLGVGGTLAISIVNDLRKAKTPEEKKQVLQSLASQISKSKGIDN